MIHPKPDRNQSKLTVWILHNAQVNSIASQVEDNGIKLNNKNRVLCADDVIFKVLLSIEIFVKFGIDVSFQFSAEKKL